MYMATLFEKMKTNVGLSAIGPTPANNSWQWNEEGIVHAHLQDKQDVLAVAWDQSCQG